MAVRVHDVYCGSCETVLVSGVPFDQARDAYHEHAQTVHGIEWVPRAEHERPPRLPWT